MGFDIFAGTYVTLDFKKSTMRIADASGVDEARLPGIHVSADLTDGQPVLPVRIANTVEIRGMFDTGTPQDMWLAEGLVPKFGLRYSWDKVYDDCPKIDSVSIGSFHVAQPQACELLDDSRYAIIGLPLMRRLTEMTFDYPRAIVTLIP